MEFTLARYKHIYSCFRDNHPSEYPCTSAASVSYNNWNYPVYIIVKTKKMKFYYISTKHIIQTRRYFCEQSCFIQFQRTNFCSQKLYKYY